jgi:hypothetical protein
MAIENPCDGTGQAPTRTRRTPLSLGYKFGGKLYGCCPTEGCEARVTPSGKLAKHSVRSGEYMRNERARRNEPHDPHANDPRHLD